MRKKKTTTSEPVVVSPFEAALRTALLGREVHLTLCLIETKHEIYESRIKPGAPKRYRHSFALRLDPGAGKYRVVDIPLEGMHRGDPRDLLLDLLLDMDRLYDFCRVLSVVTEDPLPEDPLPEAKVPARSKMAAKAKAKAKAKAAKVRTRIDNALGKMDRRGPDGLTARERKNIKRRETRRITRAQAMGPDVPAVTPRTIADAGKPKADARRTPDAGDGAVEEFFHRGMKADAPVEQALAKASVC